MKLEVCLFGPLDVFLNENNISEKFRTAKERALFAYFLTHASRPQSREMLAELFWPERPSSNARTNLRQAFYKIRQALGRTDANQFFISSDESIQFNSDSPHALDVDIFQAHYRNIIKHSHTNLLSCKDCSDRLKNAVELYKGEFLEGVFVEESTEFQEWVVFHREKYFQQYLYFLQRLIDVHSATGALESALRYALKQVQVAPLEEEGYRQLMILLNAMGRRSSAIEQYNILKTRLLEEIGVQPALETMALFENLRTGRIATRPRPRSVPEPDSAPNTLPNLLSSFFGRENELADLNTCILNPECRLITLIGMGGIGKTRLAIQAAKQVADHFPDGIWFVPLDKIETAPQFRQELLQHIRVWASVNSKDPAPLINFFKNRTTLLILDSFEHLLCATDYLIELIQAAPGLKIIVTSRERLNYRTACYFGLSGLPYPNKAPVEDIKQFPGVELFLTRLHQRQRIENKNREDIESVLKICKLVDGLPLGLELAAAEAQGRSLKHFASLLNETIQPLRTDEPDVPARQQSIRTVFEQSWASLSEPEQRVFAALPIFKGDFSMSAASAVTQTPLDIIATLVNKSLLENVSFSRYRLHPLLRVFATEKQIEFPGIGVHATNTHCEYFLNYVISQGDNLKRGLKLKDTLDEFKAEYVDLAQAWFCAAANHLIQKVDSVAEIFRDFFDLSSRLEEGEKFFQDAVPLLKGAKLTGAESVRGKLIGFQAWFTTRLGNYKEAIDLFEQALDVLDHANESSVMVFPLFGKGFALHRRGLYEEARSFFEESQKAAHLCGDDFGEAVASQFILESQIEEGTASQPIDTLRGILSTFQRMGHIRGAVRTLTKMGDLACAEDNCHEGQLYYERALAMVEKMEEPWATAITLLKLGDTATRAGSSMIAKERYLSCLDVFRAAGDQWREARANISLGKLELLEGSPENAGDYFKTAARIALDLDSEPLLLKVLEGIREFYKIVGAEEEEKYLNILLAFHADQIQLETKESINSTVTSDQKLINGNGLPKTGSEYSPKSAVNDFLRWWFVQGRKLPA